MPHTRFQRLRGLGITLSRRSGTGSQADLKNDFYFVGDSLTAPASPMPADVMAYYPGRASYVNALGGIGTGVILTRMRADNGAHASWISILWAGRNDVHNANYDSTFGAETINNMASMVALTKAITCVLEVTPSADGVENIGSPHYIARTNVNSTFASLYTGPRVKYVAIVAALQAHGDGSTQDNLDIANGMIPTSLRNPGDATHLNAAGHLIVAAQIRASLGATP